MPGFKLNFKRRHRYDISAKGYFIVSVTLLDGSTVDQTITAETCGKDCINFVAQKIGIRDVNYFGMEYRSTKGARWMNLAKPVKRQLDKYAVDHSLKFGVMFFVDDPYSIVDDVARELYYLQLRYNLLSGLIPCSLSRAISLAAYGFQVDFGDYCQSNLSFEYLLDYRHISNDLMPVNDAEYKTIVEEILKQYQLLEGTDCKMAQCVYIELIQKNTPHFGIAYFPVTTRKGEDVKLGLSKRGVRLFGNADIGEVELRWSDISSFQASGRSFTIARCNVGGSLQLRLDDPDSSKYVLQYCAQLHAFYVTYCARVVAPQPHLHLHQSPHLQHQQQHQQLSPPSSTHSMAGAVAVAAGQQQLHDHSPLAALSSGSSSNNVGSLGIGGGAGLGQQKPMHIRLPSYRKAPDYAALIRQRELPTPSAAGVAGAASAAGGSSTASPVAVVASSDLEPPPKYPLDSSAAAAAADLDLQCPASQTVRDYLHSLESDGLLMEQQQQQQMMQLRHSDMADYDQPQLLLLPPQLPQRQHHSSHLHHHQQHIYDNLPQPDILITSGCYGGVGSKTVACSTPDLHHLLTVLDKGETELARRLVRDFQLNSAAGGLSHHHSTPNLHNPSSADESSSSATAGGGACYENLRSHQHHHQQQRPASNRLPAKPPAALALSSAPVPQPRLRQALPVSSSPSKSSAASEASSSSASSSMAGFRHAEAAAAALGTPSSPGCSASTGTRSLSDVAESVDDVTSVGEVPNISSAMSLNLKPSLTISTANLLWEQSELSVSYMPRDERRQQLEDHRLTTDLSSEFDQIQTRCSRAQCQVAKRPHNAVRNRDQEVVPYDHNRFALSGTLDNPDGYYNASHLELANLGPDTPVFVAAESPRSDTRADFWRLAWESGSRIVAQLCATTECARYHPSAVGEKLVCDSAYEIQLANATTSPETDYSISMLAVRELSTGRSRTIWLFAYPKWTSPGLVPTNVAQFMMFLDEVDSLRRHLQSEDTAGHAPGPRQTVLMHCPDGSSRTGLAVCLLVYRTCLQHNQTVSLPTVLCSLRGQRMRLVRSLEQYDFIYDALIRSLDSTRLI